MSTKIRTLLKKGEIQRANSLLSYHYTLSGKIVEGYRVGRTIGFPTANIRSWERYKVVPALGVYVCPGAYKRYYLRRDALYRYPSHLI